MNQDLDIALLRTFVAIVDTGGLTSAGRKVGRTQPAITHQISRLEDLTGRTLFEDNRRKLSLTHDGEVLLEFARAMLRINDAARSRFSRPDIAGHVTLGTPDLYAPYILPDVLETFSRSHPNVEIQLRCTRSIHLHAALERSEIDIALMTNQPEFRSGELVRREPLVWVAATGSSPEVRKPLPLAVLPQGSVYRQHALEALGAAGQQWSIRSVCDSIAGTPGRGVRRSRRLGVPALRRRARHPPSRRGRRAAGLAADRTGDAPEKPGHHRCRRTAGATHRP